VIALFVCAIGLPLAGPLLPKKFNIASCDLRPLATLPAWSFRTRALKEFPLRFEGYWNDHFGFRGLLIHALNIAKVRWLHVSTSGHVQLGQSPWLFYTPKPTGMNYDCVRPFTIAELDQWLHVLEHRREWLERRGCRYLLFIPPDKQTIYPEYTDPLYRSSHARSRLDQLLDHLRSHGCRVEVVDIRRPMLEAKEHERLYHRTDSHWNDRGAFVGYQQLAGALGRIFPTIQPLPRSAFRETIEERPGGDLSTMVYLNERNHEEWLNLLPRSPQRWHDSKEAVVWPAKGEFPLGKPFATECEDPRLPRAVMFHDSFCLALQPFLSEHFRRIAYVWHDDFHQDVIERERPEVVIQELLERKLTHVVPNDIEE
jgi:hypothetical protein